MSMLCDSLCRHGFFYLRILSTQTNNHINPILTNMENNYTKSSKNGFNRWLFFASCILICVFTLPNLSKAQVLIGPSNGGDFSLGNTFAANNWTVFSGATNSWFCGSTVAAVAPMA